MLTNLAALSIQYVHSRKQTNSTSAAVSCSPFLTRFSQQQTLNESRRLCNNQSTSTHQLAAIHTRSFTTHREVSLPLIHLDNSIYSVWNIHHIWSIYSIVCVFVCLLFVHDGRGAATAAAGTEDYHRH